ncbi:hypothetical protein Dimus_009111 [Dionaea muscipula]
MDPKGLHKMYSKFGVVRDVFIPRKRSKAGRRFGFVRYDCEVAANVAIQTTNGLWVHDKEFKVKNAVFAHKDGAQLYAPGTSRGRHDSSTHQIDEDTAEGARFDIGKVKISTHHMSVINQEMKMLVGAKSFAIRIVEEQAMFICNTDFKCGCICHGKEDKESYTSSKIDDGREVERAGSDAISGHEVSDSRSFIEESQGAKKKVIVKKKGQGVIAWCRGGGQGSFKSAGLEVGRPMTTAGPFSNPNGINLEVVLSPKVFLLLPTDVSDGQASDGVSLGGPALACHTFSGIGLEKEKLLNVQNHAVSAGMMATGSRSLSYRSEALTGALPGNGQGDDIGSRNVGILRKRGRPPKMRKSAIRSSALPDNKSGATNFMDFLGPDSGSGDVDLPRKRGRPRKKSVIVKALTKVPEKVIPALTGSCHSKFFTDTVDAEWLWSLGKNLGLASTSADTDVVKKTTRLIVDDAKRADRAG